MSGSLNGAPDPVQGYRVTDLVNMALRQIEMAYARLIVGGSYAVGGDFANGDYKPVDYDTSRVVPVGGAYLGDFSPAFFGNDFDIGSDGLSDGVQPIDYPLTIIPSY
ncbi:hypothetical protein [Gluconobacter cerinus]|uniref:hypothetical protein n=1 Tax=Gluconobacter cerinus TaxID=38307 RepID=UPI003AB8F7B0